MVFRGIFEKLKQGLQKTRAVFTHRFQALFSTFRKIDDQFLDELEDILLSADVGIDTTRKIRVSLQKAYKERAIEKPAQVEAYLKKFLADHLSLGSREVRMAAEGPTVILVAGVNGTGKTTSIAKLAWMFHRQGKKVLLAASDTFRAAAIEQLTIWADRIGVEIVKHQHGADPGAVAFDAADAARSRNMDILIVDTAGRLQTKDTLMRELSKIRNVLARKIPGAPHEVLLVLDATTGQNAVSQALHFNEAVQVTGIFLAKLDGTAKGGVVVAIQDQLNIPVKLIGTGETPEDIAPFEPTEFVEALLGT